MGQGAESCGGYDFEDNPYEDGLSSRVWTCRDYTQVHVSRMTENHLKNTLRLCRNKTYTANFSSEQDIWEEWCSILSDELDRRSTIKKVASKQNTTKSEKTPVRGKMVQLVCHCGTHYTARQADINRGWGRNCSKHCAAMKRKYGKAIGVTKFL